MHGQDRVRPSQLGTETALISGDYRQVMSSVATWPSALSVAKLGLLASVHLGDKVIKPEPGYRNWQREFGCAVIGLCIDEEGILCEAQRRLEMAKKRLATAEVYGIPLRM